MDVANFEPLLPRKLSIDEKRGLFIFTDPSTDGYPPHLNLGANKPTSDVNPGGLQKTTLGPGDIFNKMRLAQLSSLLPSLVPNSFVDEAMAKMAQVGAGVMYGGMGRPDKGSKLADIENYNKQERSRTGKWFARNDIFDLPNIGEIEDWWSDRRFAQQHLTGTNPTTIELASDLWIKHFIDAVGSSDADQKMKKKIETLASTDKQSLYMQDYSYFRDAADIKVEKVSEFGCNSTHARSLQERVISCTR